MCYSAQVWASYLSYQRMYGAQVDFQAFLDLFLRRQGGEKILMPKGLTDAFKHCEPANNEEAQCQELVHAYDTAQIPILQEQLFAQRRRLVDAERSLSVKVTKKATEDMRIAPKKIADLARKLDDLERAAPKDRDDRIFAGHFCPVLIMDSDGQLIVRPMRFLCRPAGKPSVYDIKYPGTYNARRDSLNGFWKGLFGHTHAVVMATAFYENVKLHRLEKRELATGEAEQNVILKFVPEGGQPMALASLWSHWTGQGEHGLLSFALITDEPPLEVLDAGHDRCPAPLKAENIESWLAAPAATKKEYDAMLEDKERPYYAHLLAA